MQWSGRIGRIALTGDTGISDVNIPVSLEIRDITDLSSLIGAEVPDLGSLRAKWELVDLESTNGTFVHGARITRVSLGHLTRVRLGHTTGPELLIRVPDLAPEDGTRVVATGEIADR